MRYRNVLSNALSSTVLGSVLYMPFLNTSKKKNSQNSLFSKIKRENSLSYGLLMVSYNPEFISSYFRLIGGMSSSWNFHFGIGGTYNFEYQDWEFFLRYSVLLYSSHIAEFSPKYLKKMPLMISFGTEIWGLRVGFGASLNLNVEWSVFAHITFLPTDSLEVSVNGLLLGNTECFSYNSGYDEVHIRKLIRENEVIKNKFLEYSRKNSYSNLESDIFAKNIVSDATAKINYLKKCLDAGRIVESDSLGCAFVIGSSGSGKTYLAHTLFNDFLKENELTSIVNPLINMQGATPGAYTGDTIQQRIINGFKEYKASHSEYSFSKLDLELAYVVLDESDDPLGLGKKKSDSGYEGTNEKAFLPFMEGKEVLELDGMYINTKLMTRYVVGAFQSRQDEILSEALNEVGGSFDNLLSKSLDRIVTQDVNTQLNYNAQFGELQNKMKELDSLIQQHSGTDSDEKSIKELLSLKEKQEFIYNKIATLYNNLNNNKAEWISKISSILMQFKTLESVWGNSLDRSSTVFFNTLWALINFENKIDWVENMKDLIDKSIQSYQANNGLSIIQGCGVGVEATRRANGVLLIQSMTKNTAKNYLLDVFKGKFAKYNIQSPVEQYVDYLFNNGKIQREIDGYKMHNLKPVLNTVDAFGKAAKSMNGTLIVENGVLKLKDSKNTSVQALSDKQILDTFKEMIKNKLISKESIQYLEIKDQLKTELTSFYDSLSNG